MPQEDEVVRRAPLFTALDDAQAASLRASMDSVKIAKGGILFKEGDDGEHVYVIVDGKLKLGTSAVTDAKTCSLSSAQAKCLANYLSLTQAHAHQLPQQ